MADDPPPVGPVVSSNRVVTYVDLRVYTVAQYWAELLIPNVKAFLRDPSSLTVFNAALSTWHLVDWVWHERNPDEDTQRNGRFNDYRKLLLTACPDLVLLRDIAEAGKHRGLGRSGVSTAGLLALQLRQQRTTFYVLRDYDPKETDHGTAENFRDILKRALEFWRTTELKDQNLPSPFGKTGTANSAGKRGAKTGKWKQLW